MTNERSAKPSVSREGIINDYEFRALLDLFMASDPWPLTGDSSETIIEDMLEKEAARRGYADWIEAYHKFRPQEAADD